MDDPWLRQLRDSIVLDVVDPRLLAQEAARAIHDRVGLSFTGVCLRDPSGLFAMHGVAGGVEEAKLRQIRVSPGQGLGGKVVALRRPVTVTDYVHDPAITGHFRDFALREAFGGMAAVPVVADGEVVAILYAASRSIGSLGDDAVTLLDNVSHGLADLFATAVRHDDAVRQLQAAERQRIAEDLHDTVGQLLFSIGASARRLRDLESIESVAAELSTTIEGQAAQAACRLRDALRMLGPQTPEESVPVAVRIDVEEFTRSRGVPAHLVVIGEPRTLPAGDTGAILAVVREGLHNVAKHASASLVLVTLRYTPEMVQVIIQDDGRGLPPGFSLRSVARQERGWGLPSLLRRVQQQGGVLEVRRGEQNGTVVRATLRP